MFTRRLFIVNQSAVNWLSEQQVFVGHKNADDDLIGMVISSTFPFHLTARLIAVLALFYLAKQKKKRSKKRKEDQYKKTLSFLFVAG